MIVIRLKGGMGNQMFQYAFAKGLAATLKTEVEIDCSLLLDRARRNGFIYRDYDLTIFNIEERFRVNPVVLKTLYKFKSSTFGNWLKRIITLGKPIVKEKHFHADKSIIKDPQDNVIYDGWWQSELYFENVKDLIRQEFTFKKPLLIKTDIADRIKSTTAVCLNVRRTDFLTNSTLNSTNKDYFMEAVRKMAELVKDPYFFIFSDDTKWCEENLILDWPSEVVQHDLKGEKFGNYMQLMILCKHFIIPNSSFAWWAVWLNDTHGKHVIAPKNWFNEGDYDTSDLIPSNWLRI